MFLAERVRLYVGLGGPLLLFCLIRGIRLPDLRKGPLVACFYLRLGGMLLRLLLGIGGQHLLLPCGYFRLFGNLFFEVLFTVSLSFCRGGGARRCLRQDHVVPAGRRLHNCIRHRPFALFRIPSASTLVEQGQIPQQMPQK